MSNVENLKRIRSTAKARLTKYGNNLRKYITDKNSLEMWMRYIVILCARGKILKISIMRTFLYAVIMKVVRMRNGLMKFKDVLMISVLCTQNIRKLLKFKHIFKALQFREICEVNFNELFNDLEKSVAHEFQNETVLRERDLLLKIFDDIQSSHKQLCLIKGQDDNKSLSMWYMKIFNKFERINKNVDDYLRLWRSEKGLEKGTAMRMAKIPLPTFDGNRSYPRFIKDFKDSPSKCKTHGGSIHP